MVTKRRRRPRICRDGSVYVALWRMGDMTYFVGTAKHWMGSGCYDTCDDDDECGAEHGYA